MTNNRTIFITAGHRGQGTGAMFKDEDEGLLAVNLRNIITEKLLQKGFLVMNDNDNDSLSLVVLKINKMCNVNDICIDIHFNSSVSTSANGTEVYIPTNRSNLEIELAEDLLNDICSTLGTKNRGVKRESQSQFNKLKILSGTKCNSVLLEVCFLSNSLDMTLYKSHYIKMVDKIVNTIIKHATL